MRHLDLRIALLYSILACTFALLAPAAHADYAILRNGERLHISGYLCQGANIVLYVSGGTALVPASDVVRFEPEDVFTPVPHKAPLNIPFADQIQAAAAASGVDEKLISSVIFAESNFRATAVSRKRAEGLMQLMPDTAMHYDVHNAFDPAQNIDAGSRYLKKLLDEYHGNLALSLAAYNAGPERVARYGGVPPFRETQTYIRRVTKKLHQLKTAPSAPLK